MLLWKCLGMGSRRARSVAHRGEHRDVRCESDAQRVAEAGEEVLERRVLLEADQFHHPQTAQQLLDEPKPNLKPEPLSASAAGFSAAVLATVPFPSPKPPKPKLKPLAEAPLSAALAPFICPFIGPCPCPFISLGSAASTANEAACFFSCSCSCCGYSVS